MNEKPNIIRLIAILIAAATFTGCTTTYDAYGRPVQSVDPALAVAGIAAAGIIGYAIANNDDDDHPKHYSNNNYYSNSYYNRPYRNCSNNGYYY